MNAPVPNITNHPHRSRDAAALAALLLAAAGLAPTGGCSNAGEGALRGAGLGALGGLGIGSIFGSAGAGAAIGAIGGGLGGWVLADQNERSARRSNYW